MFKFDVRFLFSRRYEYGRRRRLVFSYSILFCNINSNLIFINLLIGYIKAMPPKAVPVKQQPKVAEKKAWNAEDYVTMTIPIE